MNKREYAQVNKNWLTTKAQEEGVKPLPKGIYYKVLAEGKADGKHPTPRSIVTAHYTGRTIDGKQFDSSDIIKNNIHHLNALSASMVCTQI